MPNMQKRSRMSTDPKGRKILREREVIAVDKEKMMEAGIDYKGALERFVGNERLYEKYLQRFLSDTHMADAWKAYESGDVGEVLEQVHALKGLSGTLGMQPLYEACSVVVSEIRDNPSPYLEEKMYRADQIYEKMIEVIQ